MLNSVYNFSFELSDETGFPDGWLKYYGDSSTVWSQSSEFAVSGQYAMKIYNPTFMTNRTGVLLDKGISVYEHQVFKVGAYFRTETAGKELRILVHFYDNNNTLLFSEIYKFTSTTDMELYSALLTVPSGIALDYIKIEVGMHDTGTVWIDNVSVVELYPSYFKVTSDNQYCMVSMSDAYAAALGLLEGETASSSLGEKSSISTTNLEIIGEYSAEPSEPAGVRVLSSSSDDTAAGSGVQKVKLTYLDANWVVKSEVITLNGTTPVLSAATDILHIEAFEAIAVGSLGAAQGNIDLEHASGTEIYARVNTGQNKWLIARTHVPAGKKLIVTSWHGASYEGAIKYCLQYEKDNTDIGGNKVLIIADQMVADFKDSFIPLNVPLIVGEKCHVQISGVTVQFTPVGMAGFGHSLQ